MQIMNSSFSFLGKMLTTDLDGTILIPERDNLKRNLKDRQYDVDAYNRALSAIRNNGVDDVMINTGRNFTELSENKNLFLKTDAPISAIALEDGKRLLKKPQSLTSEQWMAQLFGGKVDYRYFSDKKWDEKNSEPIGKVAQYLTENEGYIHRKNENEKLIFMKNIEPDDTGVKSLCGNPKWKVEIIPPGITFQVSIVGDSGSDINLEEYNKSLNLKILNFLKENNYQIDSLESKKQTSFINKFNRADISKKTVADYMKDSLSDDTEEIRAGDTIYDFEMLNDDNVVSIVVGEDENLKNALSEAETKNVIYVASGALDEGINLAINNN